MQAGRQAGKQAGRQAFSALSSIPKTATWTSCRPDRFVHGWPARRAAGQRAGQGGCCSLPHTFVRNASCGAVHQPWLLASPASAAPVAIGGTRRHAGCRGLGAAWTVGGGCRERCWAVQAAGLPHCGCDRRVGWQGRGQQCLLAGQVTRAAPTCGLGLERNESFALTTALLCCLLSHLPSCPAAAGQGGGSRRELGRGCRGSTGVSGQPSVCLLTALHAIALRDVRSAQLAPSRPGRGGAVRYISFYLPPPKPPSRREHHPPLSATPPSPNAGSLRLRAGPQDRLHTHAVPRARPAAGGALRRRRRGGGGGGGRGRDFERRHHQRGHCARQRRRRAGRG